MKKVLVHISILMLVLTVVASCAGSKSTIKNDNIYENDDYHKCLTDFKNISVEYGNKMEAAQSAQQFADAINMFTDEMSKMRVRIAALKKKFPNIDFDLENPSDELEIYIDELRVALEQMVIKMEEPLKEYGDDGLIMEAMERLQHMDPFSEEDASE